LSFGLPLFLILGFKKGVQAWVDPDGYRPFVAAQRAKFDAEVKKELEGAAGSK